MLSKNFLKGSFKKRKNGYKMHILLLLWTLCMIRNKSAFPQSWGIFKTKFWQLKEKSRFATVMGTRSQVQWMQKEPMQQSVLKILFISYPIVLKCYSNFLYHVVILRNSTRTKQPLCPIFWKHFFYTRNIYTTFKIAAQFCISLFEKCSPGRPCFSKC